MQRLSSLRSMASVLMMSAGAVWSMSMPRIGRSCGFSDMAAALSSVGEIGGSALAPRATVRMASKSSPAEEGGELQLRDGLVELRRDAARQAVELQPDAGEDLAELVVELAGKVAAFALLGGERAAAAGEAFALEPVEHVVEGAREIGHLRHRALDADTATRFGGLDPAHEGGQVLERTEHASQQQDVDACDDDDAHGEDGELGKGQGRADGGRQEHQRQCRGEQQAGVDGDDSREQRHGRQHRVPPASSPWEVFPIRRVRPRP